MKSTNARRVADWRGLERAEATYEIGSITHFGCCCWTSPGRMLKYPVDETKHSFSLIILIVSSTILCNIVLVKVLQRDQFIVKCLTVYISP